MVVNPRSSVFHRQQEFDFNERMRQMFHLPLAEEYQLNHTAMGYGLVPSKKMNEEDDDEFIDVIGDSGTTAFTTTTTMMGDPRLDPTQLNKIPAPPKIYYDQIEKESSDGGFFDRDGDELDEDEDEKNDLVIECDLDGSVDRKSDSRVAQVQSVREELAESDIVFNFTLIDTTLVPNGPTIVKKTPEKHRETSVNDMPKNYFKDSSSEVVVIPDEPHGDREPQQIRQVSSSSNSDSDKNDNCCNVKSTSSKLREHLRMHPYHGARRRNEAIPLQRVEVNAENHHPRSSYVPIAGYSMLPAVQPVFRIGSRHRPSAFGIPKKSHDTPQSVPLKATINETHTPIINSAKHGEFSKIPKNTDWLAQHIKEEQVLTGEQFYGRHAKLVRKWNKLHQHDRYPKTQRAPVFLPPQFGFGTAALRNLYDSEQPLDYSKNSPLYKQKYSGNQQLRHDQAVLESMEVPKAPKPPKAAFRPRVIAIEKHPTLCKITDSPQKQTSPARPMPPQLIREYLQNPSNQQLRIAMGTQPVGHIPSNPPIPRETVILRQNPVPSSRNPPTATVQSSSHKNTMQYLQIATPSTTQTLRQNVPAMASTIVQRPLPIKNQSHIPTLSPRVPENIPPFVTSSSTQPLQASSSSTVRLTRPHPSPTTNPNSSPNPSALAIQSTVPYLSARKSFQHNARREVEQFLNFRELEICNTLRLYTEKHTITLDQLFERLDHLKIDYRRDYFKLATCMIQRYGYRFKPGLQQNTLEYKLPERPQLFWDYFSGVRTSLIAGRSKRETLPTYALVVRALLDQYKESLKHFLCANLVEEHSPFQRAIPLQSGQK